MRLNFTDYNRNVKLSTELEKKKNRGQIHFCFTIDGKRFRFAGDLDAFRYVCGLLNKK